MRMCLKVNSTSPSSWLEATRRTKSLCSSASSTASNLGWERIDPGGDRGSDRRGQLRLAQALGERTCQLLEEQGVSLGHLHDALDGRGEPLFPKRMRGHCSGVRR